MPIAFDAAKRMATLTARGLDMARAEEGGFLDAKMVILVWTPRDHTQRIISMRKANDRERTLYGPRF